MPANSFRCRTRRQASLHVIEDWRDASLFFFRRRLRLRAKDKIGRLFAIGPRSLTRRACPCNLAILAAARFTFRNPRQSGRLSRAGRALSCRNRWPLGRPTGDADPRSSCCSPPAPPPLLRGPFSSPAPRDRGARTADRGAKIEDPGSRMVNRVPKRQRCP